MKREKYFENLVLWKNDPHRKPLILEGARQVGKTWLMQEFAKVHFRNVVYLRFDKNSTLRRIFAGDFDVTRILRDLEIFAHTRIDAANTILLFDKIPAWAKSDYGRRGKRPKWVVADTGLLTNVLGWHEDELFDDDHRNGKLVESWVYHELVSQSDVMGGCEISQYRDKDKREIDFIVENEGGKILGVEVKAGASVCDEDFKHLRWFAQNLAKKPFDGIVLYSGRDLLSFGDGFWAVPMAALA